MKISKIEAIPFLIPFKEGMGMRVTYRTSNAADHVLVRVFSDDGHFGVAEAPVRQQIYGETYQSIVAAIEGFLAPLLIGKDPFDLERIHEAMDVMPANNAAKAAIDIALHDIIGKKLGIPVWKLLGGYRSDPVRLSWMVGVKSADDMAAECAMMKRQYGINAFKIKSGIDALADLENVAAIRRAVGNDATLYIDGNQGYTPWELRETVARLSPHGLAWVEEPLKVAHVQQRAEIARALPIPILGDESCVTPDDVYREISAGTLGMVSIKISRTGYFKSRKIIHLCELAGIPCLVGSQGDSSINASAALHLAAAFRNIVAPAEVSYHLRMTADLCADAPQISEGCFTVPDAPGIGVTIDESALAKVRR